MQLRGSTVSATWFHRVTLPGHLTVRGPAFRGISGPYGLYLAVRNDRQIKENELVPQFTRLIFQDFCCSLPWHGPGPVSPSVYSHWRHLKHPGKQLLGQHLGGSGMMDALSVRSELSFLPQLPHSFLACRCCLFPYLYMICSHKAPSKPSCPATKPPMIVADCCCSMQKDKKVSILRSTE